MSTCRYCGGAIEFRYVDGKRTPIHLGGGYCSGWGGSAGGTSSVRIYSEEDVCRPSRCPKCHASVFFLRHNGGSVWLDDLGPPWPKHPCFDDRAGDHLLIAYRYRVPTPTPDVLIGVVQRALSIAEPGSVYTLFAIDCGPVARLCVSLRGSFVERLGDLLLVNLDPHRPVLRLLRYSDGPALPLLNGCMDPTMLRLPKGWSHIRGDTPAHEGTPVREEGKDDFELLENGKTKCPTCGAVVRRDQLAAHKRWDHDRRGKKR